MHALDFSLLILQGVFVTWIVLYFFSRRGRDGVGAFIVLLGLFQPLQNLLASIGWIEPWDGWKVNPGSAVLFPANLLILLLLDAQKQRPDVARLVRILLFANLAQLLLCAGYAFHTTIPIRDGGAVPDTTHGLTRQQLFTQMTYLACWGSILLWLDFALMMFLWDRFRKVEVPDGERWKLFRVLLTRSTFVVFAVLVFDSVAFSFFLSCSPVSPTGTSLASFGDFLLHQLLSKLLFGFAYIWSMSWYLARWEPELTADWLTRVPAREVVNADESAFIRMEEDLQRRGKLEQCEWVAFQKGQLLGLRKKPEQLRKEFGNDIYVVWLGPVARDLDESQEPISTELVAKF